MKALESNVAENQLVVGLAGGIGSGKSTAAKEFESLGVHVVYADQLARQAVEPGTIAHEDIAGIWPWAINDDGTLDRAAVREKIIPVAEEREELESIIHPEVQRLFNDALARSIGHYVLYEHPLLFEKGAEHDFDKVLVIAKNDVLQQEQAEARDGQKAQVGEIMNLQLSNEERLQRAAEVNADVIHNNSDINRLKFAVGMNHFFYKRAAEIIHMRSQEKLVEAVK